MHVSYDVYFLDWPRWRVERGNDPMNTFFGEITPAKAKFRLIMNMVLFFLVIGTIFYARVTYPTDSPSMQFQHWAAGIVGLSCVARSAYYAVKLYKYRQSA